jgi:hypothetical protein
MAWLEDLLANLQSGGQPPMFAPAASPFPDMPRAATPEEEAAAAQAAREAAAMRLSRGQKRLDPFGVPDASGAGIQLALEQAPAGTGFPGAMPAGAPDSSPFGMVPPSLVMAKNLTANAPQAEPEPPPPGAVPLPRPRPDMATDISSASRGGPAGPAAAPMSIAPAPVLPPQPGFGDRMREFAPALLGVGAALQGDMGGMTAALLKRKEDQALALENRNMTGQALLARGAPPAEVAAAVRNPDLMKALVGKYFETKNPLVVGGRVVREQPDGTVKTLADFSTEKAPTQRERKLPDGSVQLEEWDGDKGKWSKVGEPAPGERDRRMSVSDITKLSEEGSKAQQVTGFRQTFQPGYAGWKLNAVGDLANQAGRNLPESVVGPERAAASAWWQDYDKYKNVVRHGLYGASLTANEQKAFTAADITPGMDPKQIQKNLETQERIVLNSIRKKGKALIGSTYDRKAIADAYGVSPEFFDEPDIQPRGRGGTVDVGGKKLQWSLD